MILMNRSLCRIERQAAEHQHDDRGHHRHDRQRARQHIGSRQRREHRDHERAGGDKNAVAGIGEEEQHQRPKVEGELEERIELRFGRCGHV